MSQDLTQFLALSNCFGLIVTGGWFFRSAFLSEDFAKSEKKQNIRGIIATLVIIAVITGCLCIWGSDPNTVTNIKH
jgi:H+/Cl- antiporter ClcA